MTGQQTTVNHYNEHQLENHHQQQVNNHSFRGGHLAQNTRLNQLVGEDMEEDDYEVQSYSPQRPGWRRLLSSSRRRNNTNDSRELDVSGEHLKALKDKLSYFFMDPIKKWQQKGTRPWKLSIQVIKIILFTWQLVIFGSDMAKFITYKDEMQTTFKQLLLKDWDPSADAIAYPGPYAPYAVYTKPDFIHSINYAVKIYSNISELSVGPFGYQTNKTNTVCPIDFCMTNYIQAEFEPTEFKYNYSMYTLTECKTIDNIAEAGSEKWLQFDIRNHLDKPLNFSSLISANLRLPLRTLLLEDARSGNDGIVCFDVTIDIYYDNRHRDGQIIINLSSVPKRATCQGYFKDIQHNAITRQSLNLFVLLFCILSFSLCTRSLYKALNLIRRTEIILAAHGRQLVWKDRMEFIDPWLIVILVNDLMIGLATLIMSFYNEHLLETSNYTVCSLLIGVGNFLSWFGLLRYLSFFRKYNLLIVTLRKSFFHVVRFMLCTTLIYCGFCFCGWVVFGPYHFKFRELSTTTECLFALINGDDMFETFALLRSEISSIWWFSRIYLYLFVSLFIYVVLSLFIALIMDAYEIIKQYSDNGFPKTKLQSFYMDSDLTKLAPID